MDSSEGSAVPGAPPTPAGSVALGENGVPGSGPSSAMRGHQSAHRSLARPQAARMMQLDTRAPPENQCFSRSLCAGAVLPC